MFKNNFTSAYFWLVVIIGLNKGLGFFEKIIIAKIFGTSFEADAFFIVQGIFISGWLFIEEIVSPALIPILQQIRSEQSSRSLYYFLGRITLLVLPFILFFILIPILFPNLVSQALFPGFTPEETVQLQNLWKVFSCGCLFFYLTPILQAYANSKKKFLIPALTNVLGRSAMILCLFFLSKQFGIFSSAIGSILYSSIYFFTLLFILKIPFKFTPLFKQVSDKYFARYSYLTAPLFLGYLFSQASQWIDIRFGSMLGVGVVSSITYAKKLIDVPVMLLSFSLGIVLLPYLSDYFIKNNKALFIKTVKNAIIFCMLSYVPLTIIYYTYSQEIVSLVFSRGSFSSQSIEKVSHILLFFIPGLIIFSLESVIMQAIFSLRGHWYAIGVGIVCASVNIFFTYQFVPIYGVMVIPIALIGQKAIKTSILFAYLFRKIKYSFT